MYQTGDTILNTIKAIQRHEYVLPAIQREFVWKPEQIAQLFDSLMRGYPVGTLLLWRVSAENVQTYTFYDFVRYYHERDQPHCQALPPQHGAVTAVLDGQQRLTALNIGLTGSIAIKQRHKWRNNPDAYPRRWLHLDLLSGSEPTEDGNRFDFEFLTEAQVSDADHELRCWYRVSDIVAMEDGPAMLAWLNERLPQDKTTAAYRTLDRLHRVIHKDTVIAYYEEKSQELSRVLNIFIRMNSGGTVLSYSDLLLSIAVAQWRNIEAREVIHALVDELNRTGEGFDFSQDLVLKAGLVLTDIGNVGFKVENFSAANMAILEERWPTIRHALILTVRLFAGFGYNSQNLRASSVILPIAYYLHQLNPGEKYLASALYAQDRKRIQVWVAKSLLKTSGIWGSGLDTLLTYLRDCIKSSGLQQFPSDEIEQVMARRGKSLAFDDEELEEILDLQYGKAQTFSLLSLLFPFVDLRNHHHVDHVFPRSWFTKSRLRGAGIPEGDWDAYLDRRDLLPNLQLLPGTANVEKQDMPPAQWLKQVHPNEASVREYCERHLLSTVPDDWSQFMAYFEERRRLLRARLCDVLR